MATNNSGNINSSGMVSYNGTGTFNGRTLTAGTGISISNGDGVSGNPTISATGTSASDAFSTLVFVDDFLRYSGDTNWVEVNGNGGQMGSTAGADSGHPGVSEITTGGTNAAGFDMLIKSSSPSQSGGVVLGGGVVTVESLIQIPTLSTGTQRFTVRFGLGATITNADQANGVYFEYSDSLNSGAFVGKTASSSSRSSANSANTVVAGTWYRLKIVVNADASSVSFYVNGSEITNSPLATNIPTAILSPFFGIYKSIGTTARSLYVDLYTIQINLTTPR